MKESNITVVETKSSRQFCTRVRKVDSHFDKQTIDNVFLVCVCVQDPEKRIITIEITLRMFTDPAPLQIAIFVWEFFGELESKKNKTWTIPRSAIDSTIDFQFVTSITHWSVKERGAFYIKVIIHFEIDQSKIVE